MHCFQVELFYFITDMQLQELNDRFTEASIELLLCLARLHPDDLFSDFDKKEFICLAEFYLEDFSSTELMKLDNQLETYILDVPSSKQFFELKGIGDLARKMAETKRN